MLKPGWWGSAVLTHPRTECRRCLFSCWDRSCVLTSSLSQKRPKLLKTICINLLPSKISPELSLGPLESCVRFIQITLGAFRSFTEQTKRQKVCAKHRWHLAVVWHSSPGLHIYLALALGAEAAVDAGPSSCSALLSPARWSRCRRSPRALAKCDLDAVIKGLLSLPPRACPARKRDLVWWGAGELWASVRAEGCAGSLQHPLSSGSAAGTDLCRGRRARQLW